MILMNEFSNLFEGCL